MYYTYRERLMIVQINLTSKVAPVVLIEYSHLENTKRIWILIRSILLLYRLFIIHIANYSDNIDMKIETYFRSDDTNNVGDTIICKAREMLERLYLSSQRLVPILYIYIIENKFNMFVSYILVRDWIWKLITLVLYHVRADIPQ
jgi:hypothetical protein